MDHISILSPCSQPQSQEHDDRSKGIDCDRSFRILCYQDCVDSYCMLDEHVKSSLSYMTGHTSIRMSICHTQSHLVVNPQYNNHSRTDHAQSFMCLNQNQKLNAIKTSCYLKYFNQFCTFACSYLYIL